MIEFLKYATSGFWVFCGVLMLTLSPLAIVAAMCESYFKSKNIKAHGWPPAYCDAEGDGIAREVKGSANNATSATRNHSSQPPGV